VRASALPQDNLVGVLNQEHYGSVNGPLINITGNATVPDPSKPGELLVYLNGGLPQGAPYWVLQLGPATYNGDYYQWAIVSDPTQLTLWVLARDPVEYMSKYDSEVQPLLKKLGFTGALNHPVEVTQKGCTYGPLPPALV
jgi:lipocalin